VADYNSADCTVTLAGGHDRTLAVGPSSAHKCGSDMSPWQLTVQTGQRVNITLIQFHTATLVRSSSSSNDEGDDVSSTLTELSSLDTAADHISHYVIDKDRLDQQPV